MTDDKQFNPGAIFEFSSERGSATYMMCGHAGQYFFINIETGKYWDSNTFKITAWREIKYHFQQYVPDDKSFMLRFAGYMEDYMSVLEDAFEFQDEES